MTNQVKIDYPPIDPIARAALAEDIGSGDITAALIPEDATLGARILAREAGILCGNRFAARVFELVDTRISVEWHLEDGQEVTPGACICSIHGPSRGILTAERSALNFLQTLSGTATVSRELARLVRHTDVKLLDTRKTIPGLRLAQKYAVRTGGCHNHRMGLYDAFLIKENHIRACGGITQAINTARQKYPGKPIEIEVTSLGELAIALQARADTVMLDNFDLETISKAVALNAGRARLEASGNVDKTSLVSIAETGVDYISIGALTKHCRALDMSLLVNEESG